MHVDAAVGFLLELLAHPLYRLDRRIAERMHVGGLPHHRLLGCCEPGGGGGADDGGPCAQLHEIASSHCTLLVVG